MAGVPFPNIQPTTREYTPGVVPESLFQSQNGAVTTVRFGNRVADSYLRMTFQNIDDEQAFEIFQHYQESGAIDVNGNRNHSTFPRDSNIGSALAGIKGDGLQRVMGEVPGFRKYNFDSPPVITSVFPGRSSVTVELRGTIQGV
jgi:hypothetical protein